MSRILYARLDSDGDVLLAGPAVRALAAAAGEDVALLVGPRGAAAAALLPGGGRIIRFTAPWIVADPPPVEPRACENLVDTLSALGPRLMVIGTSFHQSPLPLALLGRLAGVPRIVAISDDYPGTLLDVRHRVPGDVHEVERGLSLAAAAGARLPMGDDGHLRVRRDPDALPAGLPERYVVVHPGASAPARRWDPAASAALVAALHERGRAVVVTGGPGERALTAAVAGAAREGVVDLGGRTTLAALAEVLRAADCVVVGNTGPAHLAAAAGTPVAWLHAPTVPAVRWHPWRVPYVRLAVPVACAGCRARVCPVPGHPCIDGVPVGDVVAAVDSLAPAAAGREVACAS